MGSRDKPDIDIGKMIEDHKENRIIVPHFNKENGFSTTKQRSWHMSRIKRRDTKPEMIFRKALYNKGIRYRVDYKGLPGRPDISNMSKKFTIFIDGEFWHGYNWVQKKQRIKTNRGFWIPKIERNIQKDQQANQALEELGYKVFRFWEHQVKNDLDQCIEKVMLYINTQKN